MELCLYQVDAFSDAVFKGNPAGVCITEEPLSEELMQNIAAENNLSETAFIANKKDGMSIRWFTPTCEVDLCGHATLASAHVLFNHEGYEGEVIAFSSKSGILKVSRDRDMLMLDFPMEKVETPAESKSLTEALGAAPIELYKASDFLAVFANEDEIINMKPDFRKLAGIDARGVIVTAKGDGCDFVSRFFAPNVGIDEDPVTGSAHCILTPYWSKKLNKQSMTARQVSKRGGYLECRLQKDRVLISGKAVTYLKGTIQIPAF